MHNRLTSAYIRARLHPCVAPFVSAESRTVTRIAKGLFAPTREYGRKAAMVEAVVAVASYDPHSIQEKDIADALGLRHYPGETVGQHHLRAMIYQNGTVRKGHIRHINVYSVIPKTLYVITNDRNNEYSIAATPEAFTELQAQIKLHPWRESRYLTLVSPNSPAPNPGIPSPAVAMTVVRPCTIPSPAIGQYFGQPDPETFATSLIEGTTSLVIGPSGCGKSTFIRRALDRVMPNAKVLTVPGDMQAETMPNILDLAPDVLIIDDINMHNNPSQLLNLLENCRATVKYTLVTMMDDRPTAAFLQDGGLYWPGMRPGRIDNIIVIPFPDHNQRQRVLTNYLPGTNPATTEYLVEKSEGFTGAYLKALATAYIRDPDQIEAKLRVLRYQCPTAPKVDESIERG